MPHPNRPRPNRGEGLVPGRNPKPIEVQQLRTAMGFSQADFGKLLYVSVAVVEAWEGGERRMPPILWEFVNLLWEYPEVENARRQWLERGRSAVERDPSYRPMIPR